MPAVVHQVAVGGFDSNFSYLVYCSKTHEGFVIDPCGDVEKIFALIEKEHVELRFIINTHTHFDHLERNSEVQKKYSVPVFLHPAESYPADRFIKDNENIILGTLIVQILHTPGHSPGGICILVDNKLFTGDTLFVGSCGRCDFAGGNAEKLYASLQRLAQLPLQTIIYPGHDYGQTPNSTIGKEKAQNKFLKIDKSLFLTLHGTA